MDSMEQIRISKDKREMHYYIQSWGNASFFQQIIFLLFQGGPDWGRRDMERREREGLTAVPTHDSAGMGTHDPFLSTALLSAMASGGVAPMLQISSKQLQTEKKLLYHFNQESSSVVSDHPCETSITF